MAKDLYIAALMACGPDAPANFQFGTRGTVVENNHAYRRMVAQWAVNIVDYRDTDSIMTGFEFDLEPFEFVSGNLSLSGWRVDGNLDPSDTQYDIDGDGTDDTTETTVKDVVWGVERPELLINETFAYHDRRNEDLAADNGAMPETTTASTNPDDDWDSGLKPESGAFFELYHPWAQVNSISQVLPPELGTGGVDLDGLTPVVGGTSSPIWRLTFKRTHDDATFVRGFYFNDGTDLPAIGTDDITGDRFFTSLAMPTVAPGEHVVIGPSGNIGSVGGDYRTSFGRLTTAAPGVNPTQAERDEVRRIGLNVIDEEVNRREWDTTANDFVDTTINAKVVVIDAAETGSRSFSISDPNGGYASLIAAQAVPVTPSTTGEGVRYVPAIDRPLDSGADPDDIDAIWTNGVTDNFRIVYLQRLADPTQPFEQNTNPYLSIDSAGVDLIAFNGITTNSENGATTETGDSGARMVIDGETDMLAIERGSSKYNPVAGDATISRQNFFAAEEGAPVTADVAPIAGDGHKFSITLTETFGLRNDSIQGTVVSPTPVGALTWNNRPFSSANEVANVPYLSSEWLTYYFNQSAVTGTAPVAGGSPIEPTFATAQKGSAEIYETMAFFGDTDSNYRHLLRFSQDNGVTAAFSGLTHPSGVTATATTDLTNRMVNVFDYIDVPSQYLGSETYLAVTGGNSVNGSGAFGFEAPNHGVPNFRVPGKVNINTIYDPDVWNAVRGGLSNMSHDTVITMRSDLNGPQMTTIDINGTPTSISIPSDVPRPFTSVEGAQFLSHGLEAHKGSGGTMFRTDTAGTVAEFDNPASTINALKDQIGTPYFRNELRQRLGNMLTTRSSVFSIWITVGYFHVDDFGRIGTEVGIDTGEVNRSRAFYIFDRSIPVAFEPGKNHNVDDAVLVRTIIEK